MQISSFLPGHWPVSKIVGSLFIICGVVPQSLSAQPASGNLVFKADKQWKVVDMSDLDVKAGSALDLSSSAAIQGGGSDRSPLPRIIIGATGKLEAKGKPGSALRLQGCGLNGTWILNQAEADANWKAKWDHEAEQARRQGYNLLRLGFNSVQKQDLEITPDLLDKADYFVETMGKNGIYTYLIAGGGGMYLGNAWGPLKEGQRREYTIRMFLGDPQVRKAWKYGTETLMNHVNAYTGLAWKDDPRIGCVELYNEQEWGFYRPRSHWSPQTQQEFDAKFREWLEAKYQTPANLKKSWGEPISDFAQVTVPAKFPFNSKSTKDNDYLLFCSALAKENVQWMNETLRATGYKGPVAQYNISQWLVGQSVRWQESQTTIANTYYSHPTDGDQPGSKCDSESSITKAGAYWRGIASKRFADRPFIETEFNHPFWNSYQHEGGILFGAYSALQGFDGLVIHEGAVFTYVNKSQRLGIFKVGRSPTLRANQFLLNCLWLRGDVKPSPRRVELHIPQNYLETNANGGRTVSTEQNKIALLTGFSVAFPWAKPAAGVGSPAAVPDWILAPSDSAEFQSMGDGGAIAAADSSVQSNFSMDAAVKHMKKAGILPPENLSEPSKGIFQSDTGEITMRTHENLLKVATPRSEAVTLEANKGEWIGELEVVNSNVPALVAACSVDRENLVQSKRIVLIYATDTANTGTELSPDRKTLIEMGSTPILMQAGKLKVTLRNSNGAKLSLYALGLDGTRREKLPIRAHEDMLSISIDTAVLKNGPTPFFELVTE